MKSGRIKNKYSINSEEEERMIKTNKLVMIPGPTPVVRSIQDLMARENVAF